MHDPLDYELNDGSHVARVVEISDPKTYRTGANAGREFRWVSYETDDGRTARQAVGDFEFWASGAQNFTRQRLFEALGCEAEEPFPAIDEVRGARVIISVSDGEVTQVLPWLSDVLTAEIEV